MTHPPAKTYYYLDDQPVRTVFTNNRLYFVAYDICKITGLSISHIDEKYKEYDEVFISGAKKCVHLFTVSQLFQVLDRYKRDVNESLSGWIKYTVIDSQLKSLMMPAVVEQPTLFEEEKKEQIKDNSNIQRDVMTVKQVADVLGVSDQAVRDSIRKLFPDILENGKTTFLNEEQTTAVKLQIQAGGKRYLKDNFEVQNSKTRLEKALIVQQALLIQQEEISVLHTENTKLKTENAKLLPKAITYDKYLSGKNAEDMAVVAQKLYNGRIGRNRLFSELRNAGILKSNNTPYQQYAHLFKVISKPATIGDKQVNISVTLVKPEGVEFISRRIII